MQTESGFFVDHCISERGPWTVCKTDELTEVEGFFICYEHDGEEWTCGPAFQRQRDGEMAIKALVGIGVTTAEMHSADEKRHMELRRIMAEALQW